MSQVDPDHIMKIQSHIIKCPGHTGRPHSDGSPLFTTLPTTQRHPAPLLHGIGRPDLFAVSTDHPHEAFFEPRQFQSEVAAVTVRRRFQSTQPVAWPGYSEEEEDPRFPVRHIYMDLADSEEKLLIPSLTQGPPRRRWAFTEVHRG